MVKSFSKDYLLDNKYFNYILTHFIHYSDIFILGFIVLFILGVFSATPYYFFDIYFVTKIIFSLYLLYRFNSYRPQPIVLTELDRKIVMSVGVYILIFSTIEFYDYLVKSHKDTPNDKKPSIEIILEYFRSYVTPHTSPFIDEIKSINSNLV